MTARRLRFEYLVPLAVVLLFAGTLAAVELALRYCDPTILLPSGDGMFYRFDPQLGRWCRLNLSGSFGGHTYTINQRGLRDSEVPLTVQGSRKRILMLGDSVVWGYGVSDGTTFSDVLERLLTDTDVINFGVSGYGTGEELLALQAEGFQYHPDVVVLVFCLGNDVEDTYFPDGGKSYPANTFYLDGGALRIDRFQLNWAQRVGLALNEHSALFNVVAKRLAKRLKKRRAASRAQRSAIETMNRRRRSSVPYDEASVSGLRYLQVTPDPGPGFFNSRYGLLKPTPLNYYKVELAKQALLEIARAVRAHDAGFIVVLSPFRAQLDPNHPASRNPLNAELLRFLASEGIAVVDLLPLMLERGWEPDQAFLDRCHYTAWGHQEMARLLKDVLASVAAPARSP